MKYLSIYCRFKTDEERIKWMKDHVINQSIPTGGPVFSWSDEDESGYRDALAKAKGE